MEDLAEFVFFDPQDIVRRVRGQIYFCSCQEHLECRGQFASDDQNRKKINFTYITSHCVKVKLLVIFTLNALVAVCFFFPTIQWSQLCYFINYLLRIKHTHIKTLTMSYYFKMTSFSNETF